jgi:microcystin-dependent protein
MPMAEPFLSEIRIMSFNFAPKGWALCNGQLLPINQNQALFSLLGTTYGGNGQTNFALPNLQGSVPISFSSGFTLGQKGGEQAHTLTQQEMPTHPHQAFGTTTNADSPIPAGNWLGGANNLYILPASNLTTLVPSTISNVGGSQPHQNMEPYLVLNFCIALQGIFPSQT